MNLIIKTIVWFFINNYHQVLSTTPFSYPRLLILGPTGVGKSSLGNVLAGCEPSDENCFFPVCPGADSCTKETKIAEGKYLGVGANVTLVDTPGFGDSDGEEDLLLAEMIEVLKETLEEANVTILCFEYGRFNTAVQKMILELESLFGRDRFWDNVILEVTKWAYDSKSIQDRKRQNITEESALFDLNKNLKEMFHLNHSLPGIFIDSYAAYYPDDQVQQEYFSLYTQQLWKFAEEKDAFSFFTIEDILEKYHMCQEENDCLNGLIREDLDHLRVEIGVVQDLTDLNTANISMVKNIINDVNYTLVNELISLKEDHENLKTYTEELKNDYDTFKSNVENNYVSVEELNKQLTELEGRLEGMIASEASQLRSEFQNSDESINDSIKRLDISTNDCSWSSESQIYQSDYEESSNGKVFHGVHSYYHRDGSGDKDDRTFKWQSCKISITNKPSK